jgi:hypothetical protein
MFLRNIYFEKLQRLTKIGRKKGFPKPGTNPRYIGDRLVRVIR